MNVRSPNQPVCHSWFSRTLRATPFRLAWAIAAATLAFVTSTWGAEIDVAALPPAARTTVNFDRDIRPIFEQTCLRCHGPERPKSHFRLDNRESALKGGNENANDIVPGDSARSHLIHYVARIVPDMKMPPPGRGAPLTPTQVGLLRAWIDQGAVWGTTNGYPQTTFDFSPSLRTAVVQGDESKFREIEGIRQGWGGGAERFSMTEQLGPNQKLSVEGHVLVPDQDYRLKLLWMETDLGFVRAGYDEWRRYYDDSGGYYQPFTPPQFSLGRDLHLDIGRAWIDCGLTLPHLPRMVLGYEYDFRDGAKSMLEWGPVNGKNIYPASKNINERIHIAKLDVTHEMLGWRVADRARLEFYDNKTLDQQAVRYTTGAVPDATQQTHQAYSHTTGANTFSFQKQLRDWWFVSGGYLYSRLHGSSALNLATVDSQGAPVYGYYGQDQVTLKREMHAFSLASMLRPLNVLTLSLGAQTQFSHQEGFGNVSLDYSLNPPPIPQLATARSDLDQTKVSENADLRYTGIPFTVLFAEGKFAQDRIGQFEQEAGNSPYVFLRQTDYANDRQDFRFGFDCSPWRQVALNAHYRHRESDSDYDHLKDVYTNMPPYEGNGYSAFIRHREIATDEVQAKLVLHPVSWLKTALTYHWTSSDYFVATDPAYQYPVSTQVSPGGTIFAGSYRANVYGINTLFIPSGRLYFSAALTYSDSRTLTAHNRVPAVVPYRGSIYSVVASAHFAVNPRTTLRFWYSFSRADYGQNNVADGLPTGLDYTRHGLSLGINRRLTEYLTADLRYHFYHYREPSTGDLNDYTAHGVFATLKFRWP